MSIVDLIREYLKSGPKSLGEIHDFLLARAVYRRPLEPSGLKKLEKQLRDDFRYNPGLYGETVFYSWEAPAETVEDFMENLKKI